MCSNYSRKFDLNQESPHELVYEHCGNPDLGGAGESIQSTFSDRQTLPRIITDPIALQPHLESRTLHIIDFTDPTSVFHKHLEHEIISILGSVYLKWAY